MVTETILSHWVVTEFILPFLLIFFIVFAILEKTKLVGEDNKQLNALIAFVIGMIFVVAINPKEIVGNLILFLTIALVVVFIGLILWGFMSGSDMKEGILGDNKAIKWVVGIVIVVAVIIAVLWASGTENQIFDLLFRSSWSNSFWTNISFIAVIAIALALILKSSN